MVYFAINADDLTEKKIKYLWHFRETLFAEALFVHQGGSTQYKLENKKIKLSLGVKLVCACKKVKLQINYYFMALRLGQMSVCVSEERSTF